MCFGPHLPAVDGADVLCGCQRGESWAIIRATNVVPLFRHASLSRLASLLRLTSSLRWRLASPCYLVTLHCVCFASLPIGYSKENLKIHTGVASPPFSLTLPFPSSLPCLPARGSGERCKLPQRGLGEPQLKSILVHFSFKIWHLVATIVTILLRINWPNIIPTQPTRRGSAGELQLFVPVR